MKIKLDTIIKEDTIIKNPGRPDRHTTLELQRIAQDLGLKKIVNFSKQLGIYDNPSELLSNPRVKNLFEEVKSIYDYVLIDTSSIKETIDTYLLVRHTDMTMLVCREGQLKFEELKILLKKYKKHQIRS